MRDRILQHSRYVPRGGTCDTRNLSQNWVLGLGPWTLTGISAFSLFVQHISPTYNTPHIHIYTHTHTHTHKHTHTHTHTHKHTNTHTKTHTHTHTHTLGSSACTLCTPGYMCRAGSSTPSPLADACQIGGYCNPPTVYTPCPAGTHSLALFTHCFQCAISFTH